MKVKAVQIAKELGISKATVSLALNNRPGVSEQTRQEILECRERLEKGEPKGRSPAVRDQLINIVIATKGLKMASSDSEMDLWTDVLAVYAKEVKRRGYGLSVAYVDVRYDSIEETVLECNKGTISGVVLHATELAPEEMREFEKIQNPMIIYDNESTDSRHNCVVADNYLGVKRAAEYLFEKNHRDILYLANEKEMYNFQQRRKGFCDALLEHNMNPYREKRIVPMGTTIESVYRKMQVYLEGHELPGACIMENYQISIGVMRALKEKHISVPEQLSLIGVDSLPAYMTGDCELTSVRIPHTERALLAMLLLDKEMEEQSYTKSRVMTDCRLMEGKSVKAV